MEHLAHPPFPWMVFLQVSISSFKCLRIRFTGQTTESHVLCMDSLLSIAIRRSFDAQQRRLGQPCSHTARLWKRIPYSLVASSWRDPSEMWGYFPFLWQMGRNDGLNTLQYRSDELASLKTLCHLQRNNQARVSSFSISIPSHCE